MIKVNNHFIVENRRNYERSTRHDENVAVLLEQQNSQPAISANNHFIKENSRNYERGSHQQYDQGAATGLRDSNDKVINQNIAEKYLRERTQQELSRVKGPQSESASNHAVVEEYSQQAQ